MATFDDAMLRRMLITLLALLIAGCSSGREQPVPVSGRVLVDGEPLKLGFVRVLPDSGRGASGQVQVDGRFALTTYEPNDGCLRGRHAVEVTAVEFGGDETSGGTSANQRWLIPKHYADFRTSGLTIQIEGPTDAVVLELHSKDAS